MLFPGFVDDADLPALYTLADLFAFPSLYEGFGLPPLEAMACGTPVVASSNSSLPEVLGTAALLVDAEDVAGLADAMARVLGDAALREPAWPTWAGHRRPFHLGRTQRGSSSTPTIRPSEPDDELLHRPSTCPAPAAPQVVARARCLRRRAGRAISARGSGTGLPGLVVTGVDLAEYVKFLPPYRARPAAPAARIVLHAARRGQPHRRPDRQPPRAAALAALGRGLLAIPLALAMLPPAWSPALLALPEFRLQTVMMAGCIAALLLLLVTRFLPDWLVLLADRPARAVRQRSGPLSSFLPLLAPDRGALPQPVRPGWGFWLSTLGFLLTALFVASSGVFPGRPQR